MNRFAPILAATLTAGSLLTPQLPVLARDAASAATALNLAKQLNEAFVEVADQVSPSVVVIRVAHKPNHQELSEGEDNPFFWVPREFRDRLRRQPLSPPDQPEARPRRAKPKHTDEEPIFDGQGSGIVIREEGYIMTNRHVVDGAEKIKVRFKDGSEFDGEVRGVDAQSDIAVVKIDTKGKQLKVAKLGDSAKVRVGEFAIAIGAPFDLDYSVTCGHVSAKGRSRIVPDATMDQDFIQTDASINPGNSGGPLVNISGEVIGINTLIHGLRTGIGFAVPVNLARDVSEQIMANGKFVRAWLGVSIAGIPELRNDPDFSELLAGINEGVVVRGIQRNGPASKSELKASDVITSVDGVKVGSAQQLKNEIRSKKIGSPVTLDVVRSGKPIQIKVRPDAWPDDAVPAMNRRDVDEEKDKGSSFGLTVEPLTKDLSEQYDVDKVDGVIVTEVEKGSASDKKGFKPGDVITEVNQKPVTNVRQFRDAIKSADAKKGVILNFTTRGTSKFEVLRDAGE